MNDALRKIIRQLINKDKIGNSHTPEEILIVRKTKFLNKQKRKEFHKEYKELKKKNYIFFAKKKTKKGSGWHISLNPKKVQELKEMVL